MKNTKDFRKINQGIYGAINFNNMVPVVESALLLIDIDAMEDSKYQRLLQNQYKSIKADREQIQLTAKRLRDTLFKKDEELNMPMRFQKKCLANLNRICIQKEWLNKQKQRKNCCNWLMKEYSNIRN